MATDVVKTMVANLRDDVRRIVRDEKVAAITGGIQACRPRGMHLPRAPTPPSTREAEGRSCETS